MHKSIYKQTAKEVLLQIKVARAYVEWYTSKDKNEIKFGQVMGINSKTCELYVYSFKQGWLKKLQDYGGSFALKSWAYVFPLGKYGIYVNESGKLDDEVYLRLKDSWLLGQTRLSHIDNIK
jgi:hypothetical protein